MGGYIAFDSHKRYSWLDRQDHSTGENRSHRLRHAPGAVRSYQKGTAPGTGVAVEATGNWYWIIEEIEQAGLRPLLVHARKAKLMMGLTNKTDKLDAEGLNRLQRNGTLPTVWIPPEPRGVGEQSAALAGADPLAPPAKSMGWPWRSGAARGSFLLLV